MDPKLRKYPARNEGPRYSYDEIADEAQTRAWTIWPASQPAAMPTTNMTRRPSPDMFILASSLSDRQAGIRRLLRIDRGNGECCAKLLSYQSFEQRAVQH
jgi:hypothetical protein